MTSARTRTVTRRSVLLAGAALVLGEPAASATTVSGISGTGAVPVTIRPGAAGLHAPIEIVDDGWGIPHISAQTVPDAFFGHGYVVARDRLWQIDFDRRRGLGRLAELFGAAFVPHDAAARLFLFRGDAEAELGAHDPQTRDCAVAYVAGINAFIAEAQADPSRMPLEFGLLGYTPEPWQVLDLIRIRAAPSDGVANAVRRARLAAVGALDQDRLVKPLRPAWTLTVPDGLDVHAVSEADLGHLSILLAPLPFPAAHPASGLPMRENPATTRANQGSNAWAIAPRLTTTGRPILANDPHLSVGAPGQRHLAHLSAPGLDVIGAGYPGLAGITQGHNDRIAFGRTNFSISQEDLLVLETAPGDPGSYRHDGTWKPMTLVRARIAVKGAPDQEVVLRYAGADAVLSTQPERRRAVALAAVWARPGVNGGLANIAVNLARDWPSFRDALRRHSNPTNFHYADVDGNIGWQAAGAAPKRVAHDGLLPVPGDGRYDWDGLLPFDALPWSFNPPQGWTASSNQMNLPADYPVAERKLSFEWSEPFRHARIAAVLDLPGRKSLADSARLQHDVISALALRTIALLPAGLPAVLAPAAARLRNWDGRIAADDPAATLYELWWDSTQRRLHERIVPDALRGLIGAINASEQIAILEAPDRRLGMQPVAERDALLVSALSDALVMLNGINGADRAVPPWGDLHTVALHHPLSGFPGIAQAFPVIGTGRSGGDAFTVMARWRNPAGPGARSWSVTGGAGFSMVLDVGNWDESRFLNLPGQSGDPRSPHYRDGFAPWITGEMQPLLFDPARIDQAARQRTILQPA